MPARAPAVHNSARQEIGDSVPPIRQHRRIVMEQREIVDVANVRRLQHFGAEMIERIEVKVRQELAGEVADRQPAPANSQ
jgi:hypothetical protein